MRRFWWTVWIKVAVLAIILLIGYNYASNKIEDMVSPYLIEESQTAEEETADSSGDKNGNLLTSILNKIEEVLEVKIDFENLIFDYANEYAMDLKEQSQNDRNVITEPLS